MTGDTTGGGLDHQISILTEIVATLAGRVSQREARIDRLAGADGPGGAEQDDQRPAPWVWSSPSAAAEDDPQSTVDNFVTWYNLTYVGADDSRVTPIPDCC
jgi:hypothetical protein